MMALPTSRCDAAAGECGSWIAVPFFVSFVLLTTFIVLKMMIALILENYLKTLRRDRSSVQPDDAEAFLEAWARYDPRGTGLVPIDNLTELVHSLPPPLGLNPAYYPKGGACVGHRGGRARVYARVHACCAPSERWRVACAQ